MAFFISARKARLFVIFTLFMLFSCDNSTSNENSAEKTALGGGYYIYNLIPDFLAYAGKAGCQGCNDKEKLWDSMLESKYSDFFNQIIYRNKSGDDRQAFKNSIIGSFWDDIVPNKLSDISSLNKSIVQKILDCRKSFSATFKDFNPQCDHYITVSFSFNGKAASLNGNTVLAIGLENFKPGEPQLEFTIFHELYHLHHFSRNFSPSGALYRGIWAEGMASYAQVLFCPGSYTYSQYLGFPGSKVDEIVNNFENLKKDVIENIYSNDEAVKRAYLGMEDNSLGIPPGAGYYIGLRIVMELLDKGYTFTEMTLWNADKAAEMMNTVLPGLKAG